MINLADSYGALGRLQDEPPHPVTPLPPASQLRERAIENTFLGGYKAGQIERVAFIRVLGAISWSRHSAAAGLSWQPSLASVNLNGTTRAREHDDKLDSRSCPPHSLFCIFRKVIR
jgi:hypothetical protein